MSPPPGHFVVLLTGLPDPHSRKAIMARRGKQIPSSLHAPTARRLLTESSRPGLSDTPDNQLETYRRSVVKVNHGIAEKILLMLLAACVLIFFTILLLR